jgi:hypothetical protein
VQNAKYSDSGKNIFPSFCCNQAAARNAMSAGNPLFQAFSPIPVWGSTDSDCIKVGVKIDQTCGSGGFFYKGYNFVELYNPSADVLLFVRASNAEIYAMRLSYVAL